MPEQVTQRLPLETIDEAVIKCRHCPRIRSNFTRLQSNHPDYWNQPVPASGDPTSRLLIVGLAPGLHGANKTGIPFTGDASGEMLFKVLDTLSAKDQVRITNAVKCVPPQNKPLLSEVKNCQKFLVPEISNHLKQHRVLLCLGGVAHNAVLRALNISRSAFPFAHGAVHEVAPGKYIVDSYHCSRYNTQTGRLTLEMFQTAVQCGLTLASDTHEQL